MMYINGIKKEIKTIVIPEVQYYLESLKKILFEEEYFGFEESAIEYVNDLFDDIITNLPAKLKRQAPKYFTDRYGKGLYYAVFPKNRRTQWYAFFRIYKERGELIYQIRYIANNHIVAQYLG